MFCEYTLLKEAVLSLKLFHNNLRGLVTWAVFHLAQGRWHYAGPALGELVVPPSSEPIRRLGLSGPLPVQGVRCTVVRSLLALLGHCPIRALLARLCLALPSVFSSSAAHWRVDSPFGHAGALPVQGARCSVLRSLLARLGHCPIGAPLARSCLALPSVFSPSAVD